ncbi:hypothetical protein Salat_1863300 [Sesamum alatum]|uniref:Uncharacterized protein n=1 Tax=Sesamum alatum TaxID=300844 RepID=A0AAE2CHX0_9LAMI|nr:hypothetical protein Salat_1863300 [Sesamum alatum]
MQNRRATPMRAEEQRWGHSWRMINSGGIIQVEIGGCREKRPVKEDGDVVTEIATNCGLSIVKSPLQNNSIVEHSPHLQSLWPNSESLYPEDLSSCDSKSLSKAFTQTTRL